MTAIVSVEISPGELIDKITILEIKLDRIENAEKLVNVKHEFETLTAARDGALKQSPELDRLTAELKKANESLWEIEDDIRLCEGAKDFGKKFIELARAVYITNDERARLKRQINELLGSAIVEEKSYKPY